MIGANRRLALRRTCAVLPLFVALGAGAVLEACRHSTVAAAGGAGATPNPMSIRMERGACYRSCPVYSLGLAPTGQVHFRGVANVVVRGDVVDTLSGVAVQSLLLEIRRAGFWSFDATYTMGAPNCGPYAADAPIVTLDVDDPPRSRRVIHDYGCSAAPQALRLIHRQIDDLARTQRWVTADSSVRVHN